LGYTIIALFRFLLIFLLLLGSLLRRGKTLRRLFAGRFRYATTVFPGANDSEPPSSDIAARV
jgi:hypothetical protein